MKYTEKDLGNKIDYDDDSGSYYDVYLLQDMNHFTHGNLKSL